MLFRRKRKSEDEASATPQQSAPPQSPTPPDAPRDMVTQAEHVSMEKLWLDLAKLEQEVAELAQVVATRQEEAARLWEQTGEAQAHHDVKQIGVHAWRLEKDLLLLADTALRRAKGELTAISDPEPTSGHVEAEQRG